MSQPSNHTFRGPTAVRDFLDPRNHPYSPLIELPESLNPFAEYGVTIVAKRMDMLPLANVKSLPALQMLEEADLHGVHTIVEASSGNTVFSLAILSRLFGIHKTTAVVQSNLSKGKLQMLRLFGADVLLNQEPSDPDPADPQVGANQARALGSQEGWMNPGQYSNHSNPDSHREVTGPQIWEQLNGTLTVFACGLGTGGTLVGTATYLKSQNPAIQTVGVIRAPNNQVPGVRTETLLKQTSFDWKSQADSQQLVTTADSYLWSLKLCREGIVVGPSSGFALAGLMQFLTEKKDSNQLDSLRNGDGEIIAAFICCDSPLPYLSEYFEILDESHFPEVTELPGA